MEKLNKTLDARLVLESLLLYQKGKTLSSRWISKSTVEMAYPKGIYPTLFARMKFDVYIFTNVSFVFRRVGQR